MQLNNASATAARVDVGNGFPTVDDLCSVHGTYTSCRQVSGHRSDSETLLIQSVQIFTTKLPL